MDSVFFFFSKVLWTLVQPDSLVVLLLLLVLWLLFRQRYALARRLLLALMIVLITLGLLPLGSWLYKPLEQRFATKPTLPANVDGIIVLGGFVNASNSAYWQQLELTGSAERGIAFAQLAHQYPTARLAMTGGSGVLLEQGSREADFVPELLQALQIDPSRVVLERESRNTIENASNTKRLLQPQPGETWVLITSASHMPRAVGVFCQQGWPVLPWPVDHHSSPANSRPQLDLIEHFFDLNSALHEWIGLVAYHLRGATNALFPSGC
jgi:uncharacterized SAM-binding protein YcdF (DUF218 family)